ncbi:MAG: amidase [Gammaproteobacteria bacterium]
MASDELAFLDLLEVAGAIAAREVSSVEVTRAMLERIESVDAKLGAYVTVMADSALREAEAADIAVARGQHLEPLHGVPVAVKDLCDAEGVQTLAGMPRIRKDVAPAERDSTVVRRLRKAGAVLLGKLQLTEGAVAHHHPDVPPPVNPHNGNYWSGASSSGSGVATAAGLCYGSLGSDTGGSIRFPSFANGCTGLKQTWGRVSRAGVFPLSWSLDHVGPICRSVGDCAAMLEAIAGSDADDPTALPAPVPDYVEEMLRGVKGLRVGFDESYATTNVDDATIAAMRHALNVLEDAGAEVVPCSFPNTDACNEAWTPLATAEAAVAHAADYPSRKDDYGPGLAGLLDAGHAASAMDYATAHNVRQEFRGRMTRLFSGVDVVISPALMRQNMTIGEFSTFGEKETDWPELLRFTAPIDIAGTPSLSLPCGFNADGAPFGFQLLAGNLNEAALVRAGHVYQQATDFHRQMPAGLG